MQLIESLSGDEKPVVTRFPFPRAEVTLSHTDWQIVKALRNDPRRSMSEIAKEVGVTTRTVKRRLTIMTKAKTFYLMGVPDFRKSTGVSCNFLVFCSDDRKKAAVDKFILSKFERIGFSYTSSPDGSTFVITFDNLPEADDAYRAIKRLDGVTNVRMGIMKDFILVTDWIDESIEKNLLQARYGHRMTRS